MPRNGSGVYNLPAGNPVVPGTVIRSTWANTTMNDIATALTNSLAKDGQTVPTGNLPMGGFKFTNVAPATAANEYVTAGQEQGGSLHVLTAVTETAPNTYTANLVFGSTTFVLGQMVVLQFPTTNLGPVTLNINSGGPKAVVDDAGNPFIGGEIIVGAIFVLCWDGTAWRVINSPGSATAFLPLAGGAMTGRIILANNTPFNLFSNVVNTAMYCTGGPITVPPSKQTRVLSWDTSYITDATGTGALISGYNFQPTVTTARADDNVYGAIGAPLVSGPGSTKALYGRARGITGFTGTLVGSVGAVTIDAGVTPANAWCLQLEHQGHATMFCNASATVPGEIMDNGFVIGATTKLMGGAAFQYNKFTGGGATGAFLRMFGPTSALLFETDSGGVTKGRAFSPQQTEVGLGTNTYTADFLATGQSYNLNLGAAGTTTIALVNAPIGCIMRFFLQSTTGKSIAFSGVAILNWPNGVPPTIDAGPSKSCAITLHQFTTSGWIGTYTTY